MTVPVEFNGDFILGSIAFAFFCLFILYLACGVVDLITGKYCSKDYKRRIEFLENKLSEYNPHIDWKKTDPYLDW